MKQDWFRNDAWNEEIADFFEAKLKKSRSAYHKAQYLRIQAITLLDCDDPDLNYIGATLLKRIIDEFSSETSQSVFANELLADYYSDLDIALSEYYYRQVLSHYVVSRSNTSGMADLKLIKLILDSHQNEKYEEIEMLFSSFPSEGLTFNSHIYYYCEVGAILYNRVGKTQLATLYAKKALALSEIKDPQFSRHKDVGLVKTTSTQIDKLRQIALD